MSRAILTMPSARLSVIIGLGSVAAAFVTYILYIEDGWPTVLVYGALFPPLLVWSIYSFIRARARGGVEMTVDEDVEDLFRRDDGE